MLCAAAAWPQVALAAEPKVELALLVLALGAVLSWLAFVGVQAVLGMLRLDEAAERAGIGALLRSKMTLTERTLLSWFVAWLVLAASLSVGFEALGVPRSGRLAGHLFSLGLRAVVVAVLVTFGLAARQRARESARRGR